MFYHGPPGVVLFYLELYGATGQMAYLREALAGAEDVAARNALPQPQAPQAGLYMGLAGHVFVFAELGKLPGAMRYAQLARRYLAQLAQLSRPVGEGVEWNEFNDIVYGTAGIGLVLLYAHRQFGDDAALELARRAGMRLIDTGIAADGGLRWEMEPTFEYYMPNFSHGTSGVGYFLVELYVATGDRRFLEAAVLSTRHLLAVADTANDLCSIVQDDGYSWVHAEGRRDTAAVAAQTGYMQGAAGIGAAFLRFDALECGRRHIVLPDSPFASSDADRKWLKSRTHS